MSVEESLLDPIENSFEMMPFFLGICRLSSNDDTPCNRQRDKCKYRREDNFEMIIVLDSIENQGRSCVSHKTERHQFPMKSSNIP